MTENSSKGQHQNFKEIPYLYVIEGGGSQDVHLCNVKITTFPKLKPLEKCRFVTLQ